METPSVLVRSDGARTWPSPCDSCELRRMHDALQLQLLISQADVVELLRAIEALTKRVAQLEARARVRP